MITSKQRANLRAQANTIETIFQIGKEGLGENLPQELSAALEKRELVKLRVLESCELSAREAAQALAQATGAEIVQVIGTRFVLYKESEKHKTISLD